MNQEEKLETAINQVYAAISDNKVNRYVKNLIAVYNVQETIGVEELLRAHLQSNQIKKQL